MGRDSGGDVGDAISYKPIPGTNFRVQYVMMCGHRIIDQNDKPVTAFWADEIQAARIMLGLANGQI